MANKRVIATITAVATSAALLLGGTMAWQSISQTALNEAADVVNPGGRLHDDFNGTNKDIYVENFADEEIFARIRLDEYFEIIIDDGNGVRNDPGDAIEVKVGTWTDATGAVVTPTFQQVDTYRPHIFGQPNDTDPWWDWSTGGSTIYMPTFNKNKDSLTADINGTLQGLDGKYPWEEVVPGTGIYSDDDYSDYEKYAEGVVTEKIDDEIYDRDSNDIEEKDANGDPIRIDGDNVRIEYGVTHYVENTNGGTLISMDEWLDILAANNNVYHPSMGNYWVYDNDGWVYWSAPIPAGETTGLLLDSIRLKQVMDDGWYYAINAVAQFITANDLGQGSGTGFYDPNGAPEPSEKALKLLDAIGVDVSSVVHTDPNPALDPEDARLKAADNLQAAFDRGGDITIQDSVTSNESRSKDGINYNFNWSKGGNLNGGEINLNGDFDMGFYVATEDNTPATINSTIINSVSDVAINANALTEDITLSNVKLTSDHGGLYASNGSEELILNNVTINASNKAWERSGDKWLDSAVIASNNANITINNGYYKGTYAAYVASTGAKMTINDGTFAGIVQADAAEIIIHDGTFNGNLVSANGGVITINNGTFNMPLRFLLYTGGKAYINGGTFNGPIQSTDGSSVEISDGIFNGRVVANNGTVTITGGTFTGTIGEANGGDLIISGGTFTDDPRAYVATGFIAEPNIDSTVWTVKPQP